jgi:hypothetical protein
MIFFKTFLLFCIDTSIKNTFPSITIGCHWLVQIESSVTPTQPLNPEAVFRVAYLHALQTNYELTFTQTPFNICCDIFECSCGGNCKMELFNVRFQAIT